MESIIADIVKIIKSENNVIAREKALMCYFFDLIRELMTAALEEVDAGLVEETKKQGYQIEKKNKRSVVTAFGEISYWRRRYACPGKKAKYPLDKLMGYDKYKRYSVLAVKDILQVSAVATYRNTALAVNTLSCFNISHSQVGKLIVQAGKQIKAQQQSEERYDGIAQKKKVPVLYLEGDGVVIKGTKKRLEFHRYQVCEDIINLSKTRRKRVQAKEFVSLSRLDALQEIKAYLANAYDLSDTLIISNADGGAGYAKKDFDEIVGYCRQHEHFLDVFHLNKKIKDRLSFMPAMQGKLISAVEFKYDRHLTDMILDTIESNLIDELEYWLSSEFAGGQLDIGDQEELKGAVRASLRKTHEAHLGIHHGAIESLTAGHSYLNDFSRKINQINI
ncbi:ISLre2 family transposase [Lactobacillus helveticus]|uniref:Transposase n=2 Tax=Lactobacillus helveticus TaxID=1587 RepID=A0AAC8W9E8_LACHE|nr:ISLre2 family transposase [Lactobacillus helveticus]ALI52347.1 transposase [Lactobacillus helveticus]